MVKILRREFLKKAGIYTAGASSVPFAFSEETKADEGDTYHDSVNCSQFPEYDCEDVIKKAWSTTAVNDYAADDVSAAIVHWTTTVGWVYADYYESEGWMHDFILSMAGYGCYPDTEEVRTAIQGFSYSVLPAYPNLGNDNPDADPDLGTGDHGVLPKGSSLNVPDFIEIPFDLCVGYLYPPAGAVLAIDDVMESLAHADGFDSHDGGFTFTHYSKWYNVWKRMAAYQRFKYKHNTTGATGLDFTVTTGSDMDKDRGKVGWQGVEFDFQLYKDQSPVGTTQVGDNSWNPDKMTESERDRYGITKFEPEGMSAMDSSQKVPKYRATNLPIQAQIKPTEEYPAPRDTLYK